MPKSTNAELKFLPLPRLLMLRRNPQYMTPHEMDALKASIQRDGFLAPILVRPRGKTNFEILSGNHRAMAARELGFKQVPCLIAKLDDKQAGRVAVNLNTVHGDPTAELLAPFLGELPDDVLKTVHLDDDLLKEVIQIDASLAETLGKMEVPANWNRESSTTEIEQCACPKCGKRHIKGKKAEEVEQEESDDAGVGAAAGTPGRVQARKRSA
jgi:ParB-like nuclease family protein